MVCYALMMMLSAAHRDEAPWSGLVMDVIRPSVSRCAVVKRQWALLFLLAVGIARMYSPSIAGTARILDWEAVREDCVTRSRTCPCVFARDFVLIAAGVAGMLSLRLVMLCAL